jgi:hypothetical protein
MNIHIFPLYVVNFKLFLTWHGNLLHWHVLFLLHMFSLVFLCFDYNYRDFILF